MVEAGLVKVEVRGVTLVTVLAVGALILELEIWSGVDLVSDTGAEVGLCTWGRARRILLTKRLGEICLLVGAIYLGQVDRCVGGVYLVMEREGEMGLGFGRGILGLV